MPESRGATGSAERIGELPSFIMTPADYIAATTVRYDSEAMMYFWSCHLCLTQDAIPYHNGASAESMASEHYDDMHVNGKHQP